MEMESREGWVGDNKEVEKEEIRRKENQNEVRKS